MWQYILAENSLSNQLRIKNYELLRRTGRDLSLQIEWTCEDKRGEKPKLPFC